MPMRLSGLMSGMDTESIIQQLVEAKKTKVTKAVKAQKSLKYKQDAWKDLNKQVLNLYNKFVSDLRFESSYIKKTTKVSNSNIVSVITGEGAMNSVQTLEVEKLAKTAYLTGGKLPDKVDVTDADGVTKKVDVTGSTKLSELGFTGNGSIKVITSEGSTNIEMKGDMTIKDFVNAMKNAGLSANFDETNGRIHIASKSSGVKNDFAILANNLDGVAGLNVLKISYLDEKAEAEYQKIVDNQATTTASRQNSRLSSMVAERNSALANRGNILKSFEQADIDKINSKLAANGSSVQLNGDLKYEELEEAQWAEIDAAVNEVADGLSGTTSDTDKATAEALKKWTDNQSKIEDVESYFEKDGDGLKTDANGKYVLTQKGKDLMAEIVTEVDNEVKASQAALTKLKESGQQTAEKKVKAEDAKILLNGVEYTYDKNSLEVNGLTLTVNATTTDSGPVTITTQDDTDGIYDMIKGFLKEYNTLINQMDKLYNADSAKGYDPLTDEEKEAMSDSAIEEWETKIKDSILRKDSVLGTFSGALKKIMMEGVEVNGKMMYLSNFGINTLNYFTSADNEKNAYHIDGDPDDANTSGNADRLKSMIANDPDTVVSFFTQLSKKLYNEMFDQMKAKEGYSSAMTVYDDKKMQEDYDDYTAKIKELEKKLADYEDKWYAKFAAMETALAKMQNNASAVTSLLGG
ncbi:flagellar filament capping protein FliD [uncultured Acetatifactor sp.]|uniref:flagellar filament capping protein FliD n=1 Tax=uncultured Acetatifactor sp. TaxID=1671927 RepID=UPI002629504C|nr:flagellar filament capping protein FliD [uncultured Acetatifactor sp.]